MKKEPKSKRNECGCLDHLDQCPPFWLDILFLLIEKMNTITVSCRAYMKKAKSNCFQSLEWDKRKVM